MASLTDRLSKLEATLSPADYRPPVSLEQLTDDDLRALEALTEEQLARASMLTRTLPRCWSATPLPPTKEHASPRSPGRSCHALERSHREVGSR